MDDLISRKSALDALGERPSVYIGSAYEIAQRNQYDMDKLAIETVPSAQPEIIHCRECKYSYMTYDGKCKYCDIWFPDEKCYMDGDHFCASAERREEGEE